MKQVESGKAFEYGVANALKEILLCPIEENASLIFAKYCYEKSNILEKNKIVSSAREAINFLYLQDKKIASIGAKKIVMQADEKGDVRDIVIGSTNSPIEIGISVKNRHFALKHSRLSQTINFGEKWLGVKNSEIYLNEIKPIFKDLKARKIKLEKWRDIIDKANKFYLPILTSFKDELYRLYKQDSLNIALKLLQYLLGTEDFYKIIKENGSVSLQSFNIYGSLNWGNKLPLPTRIIEAEFKKNSKNTLPIIFDKGWQISFRIHNASTFVEPSLKFDIQIIEWPANIARHVIHHP